MIKLSHLSPLIVCLVLTNIANADRITNFQPTTEYLNECGSCHIAFPTTMLPNNDWQKIIDNLQEHYGDDASIDNELKNKIANFIFSNSAKKQNRRYQQVYQQSSNELPRITTTSWFIHEHDEVENSLWNNAKVVSKANCSACHSRAEEFRYSEREIILPKNN